VGPTFIRGEWASHGLCSGKAEAFDVPLLNPGAASEMPIPGTHPVRRCLLWLVVLIAASVLMVGVPTVMSGHRPLAKQGRMSPPTGHRRCLVGFPTHAVPHLGLLVLQ
jgi:hypothetical protein